MTKLCTILIHGTWGSSSKWKEPDSNLRSWLETEMKKTYGDIEFFAVEWSGANRWRARERAKNHLINILDLHRKAENVETKYLIIGHSHGGNIATEAARERLKIDPNFPLEGVICLNTPFLKHEMRSGNTIFAMFLCIFIGIFLSLLLTPETNIKTLPPTIIDRMLGLHLESKIHNFLPFICTGVLAAVTLMNRRMLINKVVDEQWGPRPNVLCLSCADDEAITLLGLGEGIANLPQLMLHPIGLAIAIVSSVLNLWLNDQVYFCPNNLTCWISGSITVGTDIMVWLFAATTGGILGCVLVTWLFGLNFKMFIESFISRVLVSYVPLKPANTFFRALVDIQSPWSFNQLLHSKIYQSHVVIEEICNWLKSQKPSLTMGKLDTDVKQWWL